MRHYGRKWNSAEERKNRSERARKAINARWDRYRADIADEPVREEPQRGPYRITFEDLSTGRTEVLLFTYIGKRQYRIEVNGKYWRTGGWTKGVDDIRRGCVRASGQ